MKNKENKSIYEQCLDYYIQSTSIKTEENDYKIVNNLYSKIYDYYTKKTKDKKFNINAERIRIEIKLGKYESSYFQYVSNFVSAVFVALIILFLDKSNVFKDILDDKLSAAVLIAFNCILKTVTFFIIIILLIKTFYDDIFKRKKKESIIDNIKLKVLDEIEKEKNDKKVLVMKRSKNKVKTFYK